MASQADTHLDELLGSQHHKQCSVVERMISITKGANDCGNLSEVSLEERPLHVFKVLQSLDDMDHNPELVQRKADAPREGSISRQASCGLEGPIKLGAPSTRLAQDKRVIQAIDGLHWHLGEVQYLARFDDSSLSTRDFERMTNGSLPMHTYACAVRLCKSHVHVAWRPQWIAVEETDAAMVTSLFNRIGYRLDQLPLPEIDFLWRAETEEAILDYSSAYHLCSIEQCTSCRETSVVAQ